MNQEVTVPCPGLRSTPGLQTQGARDCEAWGSALGGQGQESRAQGLDEGEGPVGNGELIQWACKRLQGVQIFSW